MSKCNLFVSLLLIAFYSIVCFARTEAKYEAILSDSHSKEDIEAIESISEHLPVASQK